jgi:hypothetical protein
VSGFLVGSPAFKAGVTGDPCQAGSIPVHLRHTMPVQSHFSRDLRPSDRSRPAPAAEEGHTISLLRERWSSWGFNCSTR